MDSAETKKIKLDEKYKKVLDTPAGFDFYIAIHDFIEYIERTPALAKQFSSKSKDSKLASKYAHLKQIHQGLKDASLKTGEDLGHQRATVIRDLNLIKKSETRDSNSFWKKREVFRKQAGEIYEKLNVNLKAKAEK